MSDSLEDVARGGKRALAGALARLEARPDEPATAALLDQAFAAPRGHVIGLTGPPGVGKSTLVNALVARWRAHGLTVGVIAVDPSSQISGGALLGDRTRLMTDPEDEGVFVRSMAARGQLGGLAELTVAATVLMRALFDRVVVETVGVGQSEAEIVHLVDTTVFCVQPASGDSLQFMKAGIMELPDVVAVNKADMGAAAGRAAADVRAAVALNRREDARWEVPVLSLAASRGEGIDALVEKLQAHFAHLKGGGGLEAGRRRQMGHWLREAVRRRFGSFGLEKAAEMLAAHDAARPFSSLAGITARLRHDFGDIGRLN